MDSCLLEVEVRGEDGFGQGCCIRLHHTLMCNQTTFIIAETQQNAQFKCILHWNKLCLVTKSSRYRERCHQSQTVPPSFSRHLLFRFPQLQLGLASGNPRKWPWYLHSHKAHGIHTMVAGHPCQHGVSLLGPHLSRDTHANLFIHSSALQPRILAPVH